MNQLPLKTDWHDTVYEMRMAGHGTRKISEAVGHSPSGVNRAIRSLRDDGADFPQIHGSGRREGVSYDNLPNAIHMQHVTGIIAHGVRRTCYSQSRADAIAAMAPTAAIGATTDPEAPSAPPAPVEAGPSGASMEKWVGDDATVAEMARGLSAKVTSPRNCYFTLDDKAAAAGAQGNMARRMNNQLHRKRAAKIDMPKFWRLHAQGLSVAKMADALGVSTRTVERAKTTRPRDG